MFIRKGGKTENVGFGVFVGFDHGSVCRQEVGTKVIVGVDVIKGYQLDNFVPCRLNQRDLEEFVGCRGCKDASGTSNSLVWPLHIAFSSGWAWVEILG